MIKDLGTFEPFGEKYIEALPHLGEESIENPVIDFTKVDFNYQPPPPFYNLFSVSDALTMDIGDKLDERRVNHVGKLENQALQLDQEVYVKGAVVVWNRAGYVMKVFDYSGEDQSIQQVLFAWFPINSTPDPTNTPVADTVPEDLDQYSVGPQSNIYNASASNIDNSSNNNLQRRALCIVFQDRIRIHCEDGYQATLSIDFEVGNVLPLDVGVLVSRKYVPAQKSKSKKGKGKANQNSMTETAVATTPVPYDASFFVTITLPLREAAPVKLKDASYSGIARLPEPFTNPQILLFATTKSSETGRLLVIVTMDVKDNKHYIWSYERKKERQPSIPSNTEQTTPSKKKSSNKSNVASNRTKKAKLSEVDSPSTSFAQFHEDYDSDEDLLPHKESYYGLLDPSEISLQILWKDPAKPSPKMKLAKGVKSKAFLIHNLAGEESICIINYVSNSLQVVNLNNAVEKKVDCINFTSFAKSAVPINATRDGYNDLLFIDGSGALKLFIDKDISLFSPQLPIPSKLTNLIDPVYDRFTAVFDTEEKVRYKLNFRPKKSLVRDCFAAIDCASTSFFSMIWSRFLTISYFEPSEPESDRTKVDEWEKFFVSFLSFLNLKYNGRYKGSKAPEEEREIELQQIKVSNINYFTKALGFPYNDYVSTYDFLLNENDKEGVPSHWIDQVVSFHNDKNMDAMTFTDIVKSLHMVYEDFRIKKTMKVQANQLGYLLLQCSVILGNKGWIEYYEKQGLNPLFTGNLTLKDEEMMDSYNEPPNIETCLRQMTSPSPILLSSFGVNAIDPSPGHYQNTYAHTVKYLWSLYDAINSNDKSILLGRMLAKRIKRTDIEILIESVGLPILEVLDELKLYPSLHWSKESYTLIGRDDIYKQLQMKVTVCDPNTETFKLPFSEDSDHLQSTSDLMKDYSTTSGKKTIYQSDVLNMETERLRFGFGGFIEKVRIMLDATRTPDHHVAEQPELSDDDLAAEHQSQVALLIQRTLSLSVGRAIYAYGTHVPDLTKVLPIEDIVMSAKILPLRTVVPIDESTLSREFLFWPKFHNGVAAGLRISSSNNVNESWIDFCNPSVLEPHHGGVLFAMGLNGTIKNLPLVDWVRFFTQECELVTVGFSMGAATAYRGTKDEKVTKVFSYHIPALLPPDATPFDHSNLVQAADLLGMGLLYMDSCDRQMANLMLKEIGKNAYTDPSSLEPDYEGCALAAGFALGFITLGKGMEASGTVDPKILDKLYRLMTGRSNVDKRRSQEEESQPTGFINLDVTSPGATMALGLMYLKTEDKRVAESIEILETKPYLDYVRPDFLLIRVVAKNLIMWNTIKPTDTWIDNQIPNFIVNDKEEVSKQAKYNIIGGACLCIGLRYAGSKNEDAFKCLLKRLDMFIKLMNTQTTTLEQRITRSVVRTCVDVLCTAAAMVMAGTGNLELLIRLETLHGRITKDMSYGNHMAVSLSLGMLFMGLGGYTLTTTNEAIAGLLCAFYPFYPLNSDDNRYHLQAFRHLWALAVDSRWLMPVDVDTQKPCKVPMRLEIYEDDKSITPQRIDAPSVVPDYKLIKSIKLDGDRYWPLSIDMVEGRYQESIIKSGLIYVKRRKGMQSYESDPHGKRSITWM